VTAEKLLDHFAILEGIVRRGERREVVEALLRQTNLWDVRKQKLGGYSGGMRQRFGVEDVYFTVMAGHSGARVRQTIIAAAS
jgi:ABC-type multidrug transport system ATPase subunit